MKSLNFKTILSTLFCLLISLTYCYSQEGNVIVNQDEKITTLLNLKKELNKEGGFKHYKIQIYNGSRSGAESVRKKFHESFANLQSRIEYESPNFKIWTGNFRTRLEADRALKRIKRKFPNAFIFKPKKG